MSDNDDSQQLEYMRRLVDMSAERTQLSAERSYQNAERTLSVWVRTALGLMIFGIAIDRFGLFLRKMPARGPTSSWPVDGLSKWIGLALVAFGVAMALASGVRFVLYGAAYRRRYQPPAYHGTTLSPAFAGLTAVFGVLLLVIMILLAE